MPNQPSKRYDQDTQHLWRTRRAAQHFPAQPPHRGRRVNRGGTATLSWAELDSLPTGRSTRRGLSPL